MCCLENIRSTVNNPLSPKLADKQAIEANSCGGGGGGGGETRTGTEKRCSHNLQNGHLKWWSADNPAVLREANQQGK